MATKNPISLLDLSAGLVDEGKPDPFKTIVPLNQSSLADTGLPELDLSSGLVEVPPKALAEDNYFKQVKDRVATMGKSMYDAWEKGDFETMTGIPAAVTALNKQYYDTLWKSKSVPEFALNLLPIFGPVLNHAASEWGKNKPQTAAAELTTDILLPLLAEKIPGALGELVPRKAKVAISEAGTEASRGLMASALKPTISGKPGLIAKTETALRTAAEEAIPASRGGMKTIVQGLQEMRDAIDLRIERGGEPRVFLDPKMRVRELPPGPVDFELGPTVPPPGTKQTVLSHPQTIISETPLRAKPNFTQQPINPRRTGILLERAKNQQLIQVIDQQARDSGLLDAIQNMARKADQPVPYDISEAFNFRIENAVDPLKVAARLDQLKKRFATVNPEADWAAIDAAKEEFLRNYPNPLSNKEAQALKVRTGQILSDKAFGELKTAGKESEKTLRRGLAEELEYNIPELKFLNAREGDLIGLRLVLGRMLSRVRNWDVIGLSTPMAGVAGGMVGAALPGVGAAHGAEAAALVALALRDPWVKSKLAIAINRAAKLAPEKFGAPSITAAEARVAAYAAQVERAAAGGIMEGFQLDASNPQSSQPVARRRGETGWTPFEPEPQEPQEPQEP